MSPISAAPLPLLQPVSTATLPSAKTSEASTPEGIDETAWLLTRPSTTQTVPSTGRSGFATSLSVAVTVTPSLARVSVSPSSVIGGAR